MPIDVVMPALSASMESGKIARWLKKVGDPVRRGEVLAEIETDKATLELEAADEGILSRIIVPEGGADVAVNQVLALLARPEEIEQSSRAGNEPAGVVMAAQPPGLERLFASPIARRLAREVGIELRQIAGSGPSGRIVERDVKSAITRRDTKQETGAAQTSPVQPRSAQAANAPRIAILPNAKDITALFEPSSFETIPLSPARKAIAGRAIESKATIPHFYLSTDVELDQLQAFRAQIAAAGAAAGEELPGPSATVFFIKALARAFQQVPDANVLWAQDGMLRFKHSNIAVAIATDIGLLMPVVRRAETKTLSAIAQEIEEFTARAQRRQLQPAECQGGSSAISNLAAPGIRDFAAIVDPGHSSILAIGAAEERVVAKGGVPVVRQMLTASLSCDHRAVDGALGARLLAEFKRLIENPLSMLV